MLDKPYILLLDYSLDNNNIRCRNTYNGNTYNGNTYNGNTYKYFFTEVNNI